MPEPSDTTPSPAPGLPADPGTASPEPAGPRGSSDPTQVVDFKAYQTAELGERIGEMLGLADRLASLVGTTIKVVFGVAFLAFLILLGEAWWIRILGVGYGVLAGTLLGVGTAVVRLVHVELKKSEELLDLLLQTTARVSADLAQASRDPSTRPPPTELIPQVYEQVFLPLMLGVVRKKFGVLGYPIGWLLRFAVGRSVSRLCKVLGQGKVGWGGLTTIVKRAIREEESADAVNSTDAEQQRGPDSAAASASAEAPAQAQAAPTPGSEVSDDPTDEEAVAMARDEVDEAKRELGTVRAAVRQVGGVMRGLLWPAWAALVFGAALVVTPLIVLAVMAG